MPKVLVRAMSKSCHKCSSTSGAQCIKKRGEQAIALAGTARPHGFYLLSFGRFAFPRKEVTKNSGVGGSCICGSTISPSVFKGQKLFLNKL